MPATEPGVEAGDNYDGDQDEEQDNEEVFDGDDPKPALRIGFGRKGYHTQFITPQPDETHLSEKKKGQLETQLKERARAAVRAGSA